MEPLSVPSHLAVSPLDWRSSLLFSTFFLPPLCLSANDEADLSSYVSILSSDAPRSYTPVKLVGDGSFGTVWLCDWHSPLPAGTTLSPMQCGAGARPEWVGKRLVAVKRMKRVWERGWEEAGKLKELEVSALTPFSPFFLLRLAFAKSPLACISVRERLELLQVGTLLGILVEEKMMCSFRCFPPPLLSPVATVDPFSSQHHPSLRRLPPTDQGTLLRLRVHGRKPTS